MRLTLTRHTWPGPSGMGKQRGGGVTHQSQLLGPSPQQIPAPTARYAVRAVLQTRWNQPPFFASPSSSQQRARGHGRLDRWTWRSLPGWACLGKQERGSCVVVLGGLVVTKTWSSHSCSIDRAGAVAVAGRSRRRKNKRVQSWPKFFFPLGGLATAIKRRYVMLRAASGCRCLH